MASTFLSLSLLCGFTLAQRFLSHPNGTGIDSPSIDIPDSLSSVCGSPLNETVQCNVGLAAIAFNGPLPSAEELGVICTPQCLLSLQALHNQQVAACPDSDVVVSEGITYPPTFSFCAPQIDSWLNSPSGRTAEQNCSSCFLNTIQTELNSFFGYDEEMADIFPSLTSSCSATQYAITSPPSCTVGDVISSTTSAAPVTPTNGCVEKYVVQAGDTYDSIIIAKNISTHGLLYSMDAGSSLCLPETCAIYIVLLNDTGYSIAQAHDFSFSVTQPIAWNPNINRACSNLDQLVSSQICISWPRGAVSAPAGTPATRPAPVPTDIASGTNTRCARYYRVSPGDDCSRIMAKLGISSPDFYFLNPGVNSTRCNNFIAGESYYYGGVTASCWASTTLPTDTYWSWPTPTTTTTTNIASTAPLPLAPGTWTDCDGYEVYLTRKAIGTASYHPVLFTNHTTTPTSASTVTTTATGTEVTTPTPTQSGITRSCNAFYYVQPDDGCWQIAETYSIDQADFYKWNPAISDDCKGLQPDYYVCVGVDSDVSSVTATPTSTGSAAVTPTPVQPGIPIAVSTPNPTQAGMTGSCGSFYYVKTDDGCWDIAHDYSIELQDFYSWNPAVGDNCQGLQANVYVCVGLLA
ncbi:hypothetical protein BDV41DRAFT_585071 [Aspergillus transmontanensis]|uniref:LysM domain-containing protein n=1 Tax=Aspergillus transmontanensis TaxID=1034304 RepID=A0A5N6VEM3_9EURO|nr:hypothetical protein BDV41DRAFT_585071 [Aspergillus transmontanensis]